MLAWVSGGFALCVACGLDGSFRGGRQLPGARPGEELVRRHGFGDPVALCQVAVQGAQPFPGMAVFQAFGHHAQAKNAASRDLSPAIALASMPPDLLPTRWV